MTILALLARRESSIYIYVLHLILHMELMAACSLASRDLLSLSLDSAAAPCFLVGFFPPAKELGAMGIIRTEMEHSTQQRRRKERKKKKKEPKRILYSSFVSLVSRSLSHSAPSLYDDK